MIESFSGLIECWPSMTVLADDLQEKPDTVRKWKQRNFIPAYRWRALIEAAKQREIVIDEVTLVTIAERAGRAA